METEREWESKEASDVVNNFLNILEPWFHPDDKWDRVEKTAREFLFEDVKSAIAQARLEERQRVVEEIRKNVVSLEIHVLPLSNGIFVNKHAVDMAILSAQFSPE